MDNEETAYDLGVQLGKKLSKLIQELEILQVRIDTKKVK